MNDQRARDLDEILDLAGDDLRALSGARLYVTGGTGFVGTWMLRTIAHANARLGLAIRADVLTRDAASFVARESALACDSSFVLRDGTIVAPTADGRYDGIIHGATPTAADVQRLSQDELLAQIVDGSRAIIERVIAPSGAVPVLFTSSGAVYGAQPPDIEAVAETYEPRSNASEPPNAYRDGKRAAEALFAQAQNRGTGRLRLARLFAFLGPGLPLDAHFAAGNFLRDAVAGGPIRVAGDGTPYRSYLYPVDMVASMLAIFVRGNDARAYNVGSPHAVSIRELATHVAHAAGDDVPVIVGREPERDAPAQRYVPDTTRIQSELSIRQTVDVDEAITRTLAHLRQRSR